MPLANRNQHDPDRFRVHIACPVCESRCLIRSSDGQSILTRMSYVRCTNPICGWSGVAVTEIVRTLSPPSRYYDATKAPPPVDLPFDEAIKAELAAKSQQSLL